MPKILSDEEEAHIDELRQQRQHLIKQLAATESQLAVIERQLEELGELH
jgi:hypothetical protein